MPARTALSRRDVLKSSAGALALSALLPAAPALAQTAVSMEALLEDGPLPDIWLGDPKAPVTVIEYASTTCSHCANFHATTFKELKTKYIETGKVRFVLREFPLNNVDLGAYMIARCAGEDKRYAIVDLLFAQQKSWMNDKPLASLVSLMRQAGVSEQQVEVCLKDKTLHDNVVKARDLATSKFGVNSTPTFFINGQRQVGALSLEEMEKVILPFIKG